jgi:glycosyltransferase involved in cell wall biosynthesis
MMAAVGLILGRLFGKRVVMQTHALYGFQPGSLYARFCGSLIGKMDAVLTLCGESKRELERIGVPSGVLRDYRYWVDLDTFQPRNRAQSRQELGWVESFTVVFVGRLIRIKGADVVCQLAARMPHIRFVIVGDGPDKASVVEAAARLDNLVYAGRALNAQLPVYYSAADVTIVPSQYAEGYGRVIPESLACGTPVVATNAGGIPDAMDGTVGVLCGMGVAEYQEALARLSGNRDLYEGLRRNARPYALAHNAPGNAKVIFSQYRVKQGQ